MLACALAAEQREADIAADVGQHAPEQRMGDRIESHQAEKLLRLQHAGTEQSLFDKAERQPSGLRERRQQ